MTHDRLRTPLMVATAAFLVGGLGNVAFSAHSGSVAGLVLARFGFGAALAGAYLAWRRPERPQLGSIGNRRAKVLVHLCAALESGAVVLLIAAAAKVSTLVFTLVGLVGTTVLAAAGRKLRLGGGTRAQAVAAGAAVLLAGGAVLSGGEGSSGVGLAGVALAVLSTVAGVGASLSAAYAAQVRHPGEIVAVMSVWGCGWAGLLAVAGSEVRITSSTVAAALFLAAVPGGVGKAAVFWATARTAPYLVSATSAVALITAAIGGWVVLGETPKVLPLTLAAAAGAAVAALNLAGARPQRQGDSA